MKFTKILKVFAKSAIALTFAAFAFSCANNVSQASVSSSDDSTRTLNIEVSNYDDLVETSKNIVANRVATSSPARTIIADSFDLSGITLYVYGTSTAGTTYGPKEVTPTITDTATNKVGTIAIPAEAHNWEFTLYAVDSSDSEYTTTTDLAKNAVLVGYSSMDMANGDTAKFTLSPDGLTKTADVELKLYLDSSWTSVPSGYSATAGIYLLTTGADATESGDGSGTATLKTIASDISDSSNGFPASEPSNANFTVSSMTPGTYLFKVTFANSTTNKTFYWSDVIIVLPGKELSASIAIPNVIGVAPESPTDFKAGYITGSEDKYSGYYTVDFEWTRPSNKVENYYEIDILEYNAADSVTVPTSDSDWTGIVSPSTGTATATGTSTTYAGISDAYATEIGSSATAFASSDVRDGGSLLGGNSAAQFRLELGKRYFARIRATNDAGSSDYTYLAISSSDTLTNTSAEAFTSTTINRYRVTYYANGGSYYTSTSEITDTSALTSASTNIVAYFCQSTTGNAIIQGDGKTAYTIDSSTSYYKYVYGSYDWSYWNYYDDSGDATKYEDSSNNLITSDTGYENLDLYAVYTGEASVEIDDKKAYEILNTWITLSVDSTTGTSSGPTAVTSGTGATATITFANGYTTQAATWKFLPITDSNKITSSFTFDKVNFTVSQSGKTYTSQEAEDVDTSSGTSFTQDLTNLSSGTYNVLFTAHTGTTVVSYPITLTIAK